MNNYKIEIKPNKSYTYVLPVLDMAINFKFLNQIKNTYLFNNEKELQFSVLYKFSGKVAFSEYEDILMNHPLFIGHEDYGEHTLYKFHLTEDMAATMNLFLEGKYSKFPIAHKDAIENMINRRGLNNANRIRMILDKDPIMRQELSDKLEIKIPVDNELSEAPNIYNETFSNFVTKTR